MIDNRKWMKPKITKTMKKFNNKDKDNNHHSNRIYKASYNLINSR